MPEVDRIVPNAMKLSPAAWGAASAPRVRYRQARAFVPVQTGCDHSCTFCAIPAGRGPSVSDDPAAVIARIAEAVADGHAEVVLTGVDLTSYAAPGAATLGALVERILLAVPGLRRLRLSSLDTIEIDPLLFEIVTGEARVMPHLHLSLQAGDDLVLKRMKRRHSRADAVRMVERIKARRDVAIGADLIAGFPTESEAQAANTRALLADCDVVHAHVFPYSPRPGTPAARMPQVEPEVRRARAAALREAAAARHAGWLRGLVGSVQEIVAEKPGDRGHAAGFADVRLAGSAAVGSLRAVRVTAAAPTHLIGEPA